MRCPGARTGKGECGGCGNDDKGGLILVDLYVPAAPDFGGCKHATSRHMFLKVTWLENRAPYVKTRAIQVGRDRFSRTLR